VGGGRSLVYSGIEGSGRVFATSSSLNRREPDCRMGSW
jgi:hypothetical protein